jgi:hypothetical protein
MKYRAELMRVFAVLICIWAGGSLLAQQATQPETVMVTLHAKPGVETDLQEVITRHWTTARQLQLVRDTPHLTVRGTEGGNKTYFVDVFTWRDSRTPDAAPTEIQKIWTEMNRLVEARDGHRGIEIFVVSAVSR